MIRAFLLVVAGCGRAPVSSCEQDLAGTYLDDDGRRWMVLDHRTSLEAYPLFPDVPDAGALEVAPRVIDLVRSETITGQVTRRYMRGSAGCIAKARARVTACASNALELVLADPTPPLDFAPCRAGTRAPSRRVRWSRER